MRIGIAVKESFFTSLCLALKFEVWKSFLDCPVDLFFGIYRSAICTGSCSTMFHLPALFTFFAHKTRALSALNWIFHHEWTNNADKVLMYWSGFNDVFFVELVCYCLLALSVLQMRSYCLLGKLYVGFKHFFDLFLNHWGRVYRWSGLKSRIFVGQFIEIIL